LNSVALLLFPFIGDYLNLSQTQFGMWCAIAIHDTSSVVGAASKYGSQALEIATTVKLARALWIIPIAFLSTFLFKTKKQNQDSVLYWFVCTRYVREYVPTLCPGYQFIPYYYRKIGFDIDSFLSVADFQRSTRISRLQTLTARNSAVVTNLFDGVVGGY
jgi:uncharacterized membrane protein YadS